MSTKDRILGTMPEHPDAMPKKAMTSNATPSSPNVVSATSTSQPSVVRSATPQPTVQQTAPTAVATNASAPTTAVSGGNTSEGNAQTSAQKGVSDNVVSPSATAQPPTAQTTASQPNDDDSDYTFTEDQLRTPTLEELDAKRKQEEEDSQRPAFADARKGVAKDGEQSEESKKMDMASDRLASAYQDAIDKEKAKEETPEQKKKRERRERAKKIIAAIGDGVSAMANLGFARKGAASKMYPEYNLTRGLNEKFEKLKNEREESRNRVLSLQAKLAEIERMKYERARSEAKDKQTQDNWNKQYALSEREEQRRRDTADSQNALRDVQAMLYDSKVQLTESQKELIGKKIDQIEELYPLQAQNLREALNVKRSQVVKNNAQATKARSGGGSKRGGGGAKTTITHTETSYKDGKKVTDRTTTKR